jgi:hypothetical protein
VEDLPDRRVGDFGEAIGRRSERLSQRRERPGRRAVGLGCRLSPDLAEDPLAGRLVIDSRLPAALAGRCGGQAVPVKAGDQVGDGIDGTSADGTGGLLRVIAAGDGQEDLGPDDLGSGLGLRSTELGQGLAFGVGEQPKGVLLATRHGGLRVSRGRPS